MKSRRGIFPRTFLCVALFVSPALTEPADGGDTPAVIVINPGSHRAADFMRGWRLPYGRRFLHEWGRSRGLDIIDDREPVVDNLAAYLSPSGSRIIVPGLARGKRYRLWVDFVRFRGEGALPPAMLRISAAAPGGRELRLAEIRHADLGGGYYHLDLPREATVHGVAEIVFTEYSVSPGCWGVWDIIIAEGEALPGRGAMPAEEVIDLEIKERIVE